MIWAPNPPIQQILTKTEIQKPSFLFRPLCFCLFDTAVRLRASIISAFPCRYLVAVWLQLALIPLDVSFLEPLLWRISILKMKWQRYQIQILRYHVTRRPNAVKSPPGLSSRCCCPCESKWLSGRDVR